ncbi:MAG TPA: preprotein translocase subunit SecA [Oligoflexia bacterium]|nr:preprotein translocase subunit SecA [Oligoflexia bacterium]HMP26947.1 preprotein translocase subunit SecA [Oligoflexia bacterium]
MFGFIAKKIFGTHNERFLRSLTPLVAEINLLEKDLEALSNDQIRSKTSSLKERVSKGESLDNLIPEAFALVREASKRTLGIRHFDVQLLGGMVLHRGKIAEMKTGEGKTLVATLPAYLNALAGNGVHIVTVNDYLAKRDAEWMGQLYKFLGLTVGVVHSGMRDDDKRAAYQADITYGQNNEFGFDYLRDNMKFSLSELYQRGHYFGIVDEVDSILIDEARTPLIISGPAEESTDKYYAINNIIPKLKKEEHYEIDLKSKHPHLNEAGIALVESLLKIENLYDPANIEVLHHVNQGLKAHTTMERDVDYVVKDGQIIIVDEFTGRLMPGRRWSNGLHQAIEAKEGLKVQRENRTLASITFQNYFRMYKKLSGMTGSADTEAAEFKSIYGLDVIVVPPNRPMIREDLSDSIYRTRVEKYNAVVEEIEQARKKGQPTLVGTISIDQSEKLSSLLKTKGVEHNVLNAKHHEKEAEIIAQAGRFGAVTISTNMAGRGTDILLGGNPEFLAQRDANTKNREDSKYQEALKKYQEICSAEKEKVIASGGLYVIGTERHESRRIDNQLRGRSGRQGDPGRSRFYISFEDDLMVRFGIDRYKNMMTKMGWEEGAALDGKLISKTIETAQKRVEGFHYESRKHVTEYDDVMNKQRQVVYNLRNRILRGDGVKEEILNGLDDLLEALVLQECPEDKKPIEWNLKKVAERYKFLFNSEWLFTEGKFDSQQVVFDHLRQAARVRYAEQEKLISEKLHEIKRINEDQTSGVTIRISRTSEDLFEFSAIETETLLEMLDYFWNIHIQDMDELREGIGLRGYGQKNPLHEFQKEGFVLFQGMLERFKETVVRKLFYYEIPSATELLSHIQAEQRRRAEMQKKITASHPTENQSVGFSDGHQPKDPEEQRRKLAEQRKIRRAQNR